MELFAQLRREYESGAGTILGVSQKYGVLRRLVRQAIMSISRDALRLAMLEASVAAGAATIAMACVGLFPQILKYFYFLTDPTVNYSIARLQICRALPFAWLFCALSSAVRLVFTSRWSNDGNDANDFSRWTLYFACVTSGLAVLVNFLYLGQYIRESHDNYTPETGAIITTREATGWTLCFCSPVVALTASILSLLLNALINKTTVQYIRNRRPR